MDTLMLDAYSTNQDIFEYTKLAAVAILTLTGFEPDWWKATVRLSKDDKGVSSAVLTLGGTIVEVDYRGVKALVVTLAGMGKIDLLANRYTRNGDDDETETAYVWRRGVVAVKTIVDAAVLRALLQLQAIQNL